MKHRQRRRRLHGRAGLPRLPSRGLIEAHHAKKPRKVGFWNFPGYQAGASLKPTLKLLLLMNLVLTSPVTKPGPH